MGKKGRGSFPPRPGGGAALKSHRGSGRGKAKRGGRAGMASTAKRAGKGMQFGQEDDLLADMRALDSPSHRGSSRGSFSGRSRGRGGRAGLAAGRGGNLAVTNQNRVPFDYAASRRRALHMSAGDDVPGDAEQSSQRAVRAVRAARASDSDRESDETDDVAAGGGDSDEGEEDDEECEDVVITPHKSYTERNLERRRRVENVKETLAQRYFPSKQYDFEAARRDYRPLRRPLLFVKSTTGQLKPTPEVEQEPAQLAATSSLLSRPAQLAPEDTGDHAESGGGADATQDRAGSPEDASSVGNDDLVVTADDLGQEAMYDNHDTSGGSEDEIDAIQEMPRGTDYVIREYHELRNSTTALKAAHQSAGNESRGHEVVITDDAAALNGTDVLSPEKVAYEDNEVDVGSGALNAADAYPSDAGSESRARSEEGDIPQDETAVLMASVGKRSDTPRSASPSGVPDAQLYVLDRAPAPVAPAPEAAEPASTRKAKGRARRAQEARQDSDIDWGSDAEAAPRDDFISLKAAPTVRKPVSDRDAIIADWMENADLHTDGSDNDVRGTDPYGEHTTLQDAAFDTLQDEHGAYLSSSEETDDGSSDSSASSDGENASASDRERGAESPAETPQTAEDSADDEAKFDADLHALLLSGASRKAQNDIVRHAPGRLLMPRCRSMLTTVPSLRLTRMR